jgi:hypothetical protein
MLERYAFSQHSKKKEEKEKERKKRKQFSFSPSMKNSAILPVGRKSP